MPGAVRHSSGIAPIATFHEGRHRSLEYIVSVAGSKLGQCTGFNMVTNTLQPGCRLVDNTFRVLSSDSRRELAVEKRFARFDTRFPPLGPFQGIITDDFLRIYHSFNTSTSGTPTEPDGGLISRYAAIVAAMSWGPTGLLIV